MKADDPAPVKIVHVFSFRRAFYKLKLRTLLYQL
jgi:hypothetical protein